MTRYFEYGAIFVLLFAGLLMLLYRVEFLKNLRNALIRARISIDEQDRQTKVLRRKNLRDFEKKNTLWLSIEKQIEYSGLRLRFPSFSAGKLIVINVVVTGLLYWIAMVLFGLPAALLVPVIFLFAEFMLLEILKSRNLKMTDEELPKLLDFLGNYSLTSGELMSIFSQISRYLKEPLRSALEECEAESRITGDMNMALISMAERIEHPQFKQLVRNLEITARYSADFKALVADSRRSMREYLSQNRDRKGMLREAGINMGLLLIMSVIVLLIVNLLIGGGVTEILFTTFVGRCAVGGMVFILILFMSQVFKLNK